MGTDLIIGFKSFRARMQVIGYFRFFLNAVFKLLDMACCFVSLGKGVDISLAKGSNESMYNTVEHVHCESCKVINRNLG